MSDDAPNVSRGTIEAQFSASNPEHSAWVSANAGSGKTHVLTQRVIRLMMDGVAPSRILCLTFTNAAAAEMSNRVFKQLSSWTALDDDALRKELEKNGEFSTGSAKLKVARQLFTRALESPGGLKIQTIHAFCTSLLQQFPLEANASGHFEVIDDLTRAQLLTKARQDAFVRCAKEPALAEHLSTVMAYASDDVIEKTLAAVTQKRGLFSRWIADKGGVDAAVEGLARRFRFDLSIDSETFAATLLGKFILPISRAKEIAIVARGLGNAGNVKYADGLEQLLATSGAVDELEARLAMYLTRTGSVIQKLPGNKDLRTEITWLEEVQESEKAIATEVVGALASLRQLKASRSLFHIADSIIDQYEAAKRARGLVDYDDLISRASDLLNRSDLRQWVKYKLDSGTDHILVDEGQDTSPTQWEIILALCEEFFAGQGARQKPGTIFVVGDEKQSIFSFQGAEPEKFAEVRQELVNRSASAPRKIQNVALRTSFRSTPDVLGAVDLVFGDPANARGLASDAADIVHEANRQHDPGEVQVWPHLANPKAVKKTEWNEPLDAVSQAHSTVQLARQISTQIKSWITSKEVLPGQGRAIGAGDILVLVRKRDGFVNALMRQLKADGVSVAGADRLKLNQHIATKDLLALAKWALLPEDDLSLAACLKSPVFGVSEKELFDLAHGRGGQSIWSRAREDVQLLGEERMTRLHWAVSQAGRGSAFGFFATLLGQFGGRRAMKQRLGDEVDDVLDAFLHEALNHDHNGGGGLQDFVQKFEQAELEIKREMDLQHDEVRIMTAHSSKGLEAPIVFLVDPGSAAHSSNHRSPIVVLQSEKDDARRVQPLIWQPTTKDETPLNVEANSDLIARAEDEYRRLLYVGMTRASDRLIVCGYGMRESVSDNWHSMVEGALADSSEMFELADGSSALRWVSPKGTRRPRELEEKASQTQLDTEALPSWTQEPARREFPPPAPLAPSLAGLMVAEATPVPRGANQDMDEGASTITGVAQPRAKGLLVHQLLEFVPDAPASNRDQLAQQIAERYAGHLSSAELDQSIDQALRVIDDQLFGELFAGKSKAEVSICGTLNVKGKAQEVAGQIDRLCIFEDRVLVVDYKSDRLVPTSSSDVNWQYVIQLAIYRELVKGIFPDKQVEAAILWTSAPQLMPFDGGALDAKLTQWAG